MSVLGKRRSVEGVDDGEKEWLVRKAWKTEESVQNSPKSCASAICSLYSNCIRAALPPVAPLQNFAIQAGFIGATPRFLAFVILHLRVAGRPLLACRPQHLHPVQLLMASSLRDD